MKRCLVRTAIVLTLFTQFYAPEATAQRRPDIAAVTRTINDCEERTDRFIKTLRRALDDSSVSHSHRDDLLRSAKDLEEAMDKTGDSWNKRRDPDETRRHVRRALDAAQGINRTINRGRLNFNAEQEWGLVRRELNLLARAFDLPQMSR